MTFNTDCVINGEDVITHEQRIMGNGVIIPPHEFKQPSRWYNRVHEVTKYEFGVVTHGMTSITHFTEIHTDIIQL
jgi:hypothetical protein